MKKMTMILLLVLMVGAVMAKPPTKQEKKAQKQAEIAAVLDVIKAGRFIIYEPLTSEKVSGGRVSIASVDITDSTYSKLISIEQTDKTYTLKFMSNCSLRYPTTNTVIYYKKNGYLKVFKYSWYANNGNSAYYTDVVRLID